MQRHLPLLSRYLDLPSLSPFLIARKLTTFDEFLKLKKQWQEGHRQDTVVELLAVLQRKCPEWEDRLLEALQESVQLPNSGVHLGHKHILGEIGKQPILCYHCGDGLKAVSTTANLERQVDGHLQCPNHRYHPDCIYCSRLLEKIDELIRENVTLKLQNRVLELAQGASVGVKEPEAVPAPSFSTTITHSAVESETYTQQRTGDHSFGTETKNLSGIAEEVVERAIKAAAQKQPKTSAVKP